MRPLQRLRLRLTAWYAGTFALLLLALGIALYLAVSRQVSAELDRSLQALTAEVFRAARIRMAEGYARPDALLLALNELDAPDRALYLFAPGGEPLAPDTMPHPRVRGAAARAAAEGTARDHFSTPADQRWRLYAARPPEPSAPAYVVVALADAAGIERQYARLLEALLVAGLLALVPVVAGGYWLSGISARPVEEALERMRRFTADAAHELRTPVAVIRGRSELALEQAREPSAYVAALDEIAREGERLGRIVDDLLLLARADAGERPLARERLFLDDLASDALRAASVLARRHGVQIQMGDYEEAPVIGDAALLRQLLLILLDNAIKFSPAGGRVRLDVRRADGRASVSVSDEGIGIAAADLPHVFERFFRADAARGRAGGAGLGLSIARWIAEAHGARIEVASEVGKGSRFTVAFPAAE